MFCCEMPFSQCWDRDIEEGLTLMQHFASDLCINQETNRTLYKTSAKVKSRPLMEVAYLSEEMNKLR